MDTTLNFTFSFLCFKQCSYKALQLPPNNICPLKQKKTTQEATLKEILIFLGIHKVKNIQL